jgi:hypothetical protein
VQSYYCCDIEEGAPPKQKQWHAFKFLSQLHAVDLQKRAWLTLSTKALFAFACIHVHRFEF